LGGWRGQSYLAVPGRREVFVQNNYYKIIIEIFNNNIGFTDGHLLNYVSQMPCS